MLTKQKSLETRAEPQTGMVWYACFKKPGKTFLGDFSWVVYDTNNPQIPYPFSAYMMRLHPNGDLEMRFNDHGLPPADHSVDVTVSIRHPSSV